MSKRYNLRSCHSAGKGDVSASHKRNSSSSCTLSKRAKPKDDLQIHLPPEILSLIFEFLPLRDRKSVRRTCKLWNESSKRVFFANKEKFVFRENQDNIVHILSTSNYPFLNLEFLGLNTICLPNNIWKECGHKIQSLHFYRCDLYPKTVVEIILRCINLKNFQIYKSCNPNYNNIAALSMLKHLNIEKGVKRSELKIFCIKVSDRISCDWWEHLFAVFPNVKHFSTSLRASKVPSSLAPPLQLQTLSLHCTSENYFSLDRSRFPLLWTSRLTEFTSALGFDWTKSSVASLFRFFSEQKDLEVIDLKITKAVFFKDLLFRILKYCPKLRELRISFTAVNIPKTSFSCEEAKKFFLAIANLQRLDINHDIEIETLPVLPSLNLALRSLTIKNDADHINFCVFMLSHAPKLEYLELNEPTDEILQLTFRTQSELRSLRVHDGFVRKVFSPYGLAGCGREFSIQRLQKLEYLEIISIKSIFTDRLIPEFRFPQLRTLKLWMRLGVSHTELGEMFSHIPQLRDLNLNNRMVIEEMDELISMCKRAKELTSLLISPDSTITFDETSPSSHCKRLFNENSNLKYFIKGDEFLLRHSSTQLSRYSPIKNFWVPESFHF